VLLAKIEETIYGEGGKYLDLKNLNRLKYGDKYRRCWQRVKERFFPLHTILKQTMKLTLDKSVQAYNDKHFSNQKIWMPKKQGLIYKNTQSDCCARENILNTG
jgi:hypothetical protein